MSLTSTANVDYHLLRLEKRGLINREAHQSRSISLPSPRNGKKTEDSSSTQVERLDACTLSVEVVREGKTYRGRLYVQEVTA